jgi:Ser/Thr protein kinase RdoA (MazF antagonist)
MTSLDITLRQAPLPRLIIHGDYGLHNLVFPKNGLVTMLDFETARLEWRLSDLVSALSRLRFRDGRYDFETIASFLSAYQAEYPIRKEEWHWLPKVWRFYKLRSSLIYWNSYLDTGGPRRKLISAQDAVEQANWVIQHPERLLELIPALGETT